MSVPAPAPRPAPATIERRHLALFWGMGTISLGGVIGFLLSQGDLRTITLVLLAVLGLLCLAPRRGIYILLTFLPFMYFLRRQVLYFNEFSQTDPILLFPPLVTIAMFLGFLIFYNEALYRYVRRSTLLRVILGLAVLFVVQMVNPLQGSVLIGVAGALYFIIPMLWVFLGLLLEEKDVRRIFAMIMVIGTVTAVYGIYQHYFGFSAVESYELESKGFYKAFGEKVRVMSTFAGLADFSVYISLAGFLMFAHYWRTKTNAVYLALFGVIAFALVWIAIRTTILVLIFSVIAFLIVYARGVGLILARGAAALAVIGALYGYLYTMTPEQVYAAHGSSNPFIAHTVAGVTHPTEESTFQKRLGTWTYVVGRGLIEHPFGRGLGSTTTAAMKFAGGDRFEADSYFFEIIYGSGPLAAVLFLAIMLLFFRDALRLAVVTRENFTHKVVIGILSAFFLGSIFGLDLRDPVNAPLAWLLIGWTIREVVDGADRSASPAPA